MARDFGGYYEANLLHHTTPIGILEPFTMSCRFKCTNGLSSANQWWFHVGDGTVNNRVGLWTYYGTQVLRFVNKAGGAGAYSESSYTLSMDTWYTATGVARSTGSSVYVNGGNAGHDYTSVGGAFVQNRLSIGAVYAGGWTAYAGGHAAEAAIWDVELNTDEIAMLGLGVSPLMVRPQSLVTCYMLVRGKIDWVGGYELSTYNNVLQADHPPTMFAVGPALTMPGIIPVPALTAEQVNDYIHLEWS